MIRSRRRTWALALVLSSALLVGACSSNGEAETNADSQSETVTVAQRFGDTTLPVAPERIVASEGPWLDALLAFGVQPVAYISNGSGDDGLNAWERPGIGDAEMLTSPEPNSALPLEAIAAVNPDLILVNPYIGKEQAKIEAANAVAPTLSRLGTSDLPDQWQDQVTTLGLVLGKEAKAKAIIAGVEDVISGVHEELPGLAGRTALLVQVDLSANTMNVVSAPEDPANQLFAQLGMSVPESVTKEASQSGRAPVSLERVDLLDADYLMIYAHGSDQEKLSAAIPGFADLRAVRSGAVTYADTEKVLAFYSPGPLSLTWGIDGIVPQLSKAAAAS